MQVSAWRPRTAMTAHLIFGVLGGVAIFVAVFLVLTCCYVRDWEGKVDLLRMRFWRKGRSRTGTQASENSRLLQHDCQTLTLPASKSSGILGPCGISESHGEQSCSFFRSPTPTEANFTCAAIYGTFDRVAMTSQAALTATPPPLPPLPPPPPAPTTAATLPAATTVPKVFLAAKEENAYFTPRNSPPNNSPFSTPPESVADEKELEERYSL